jgi:hypothetical protein
MNVLPRFLLDASQTQAVESTTRCDCEAKEGVSSTPARHWFEVGLLLALWLLHSAGNLWWLKVDTRPPYSDMAGHAITTLRMASWAWRQLMAEGSAFQALLDVNPYPPFFYMTAAPFAWLVAPTADALLVVNMLYFGLLILSTYGIGRLAAGERCGLLAAFLVSMVPILYGLSRQFLPELALVAMTTFAVFCLFWSESFRRRWPSLLLGVTIGLGMLTKWTLIVFLVGPLAIALYVALRHATRARLLNVVLAGMLALAIALPWYLYNLETLQAFLQFNRFQAPSLEGEAPVWTLASWLYYLRELLNQQVLLPFCLLYLLGIVLALRRCRLNAYLWMLLAWVVIGYVVSTLFINKDTRYTLPYLPALALLAAIGLVQIRQVMVQRVGLALILLYALLQYAGLTVGLSDKVTGIPTEITGSLAQMPVTLYSETIHNASPARVENWQIDAILDALLADASGRAGLETPVQLVVIPTSISFDTQTFTYARWRDRLPLQAWPVTGVLAVDGAATLQRSDYVVTKSGDLGWEFALQDAAQLTAQLLDPNSTLRREFEPVAAFPLPDGSVAQLFRHIHEQLK